MALLQCAFVVALVASDRLVAVDRLTVLSAAKQATTFLTDHVSTQGGYLWRYSADLSLKEGEGVVTSPTIWVQPPGTPLLGEAFIDLYQATGDQQFLQAAISAAKVLLHGQMRSGGWQDRIELEPIRREKWAYRQAPPSPKAKDQSSLDDNKTQSALHFLIRLDKTLEMQNAEIHEAVNYGLDCLLKKGQLPGGGFPQVWTDQPIERDAEILQQASFPDEWSRNYPGHNSYWNRYTLNDNLALDVVQVLLLANEVYGEKRYLDSVIQFADSLLRTQLPHPQPAWAQQYNDQVQPTWARKFEPPAVATSESFDVIRTLLLVNAHTGEKKYMDAASRALEYLKSCRLPDGRVARFYELQTNRPLYFDRTYQLTYDDSDVPTHYSFKLADRTDSLQQMLKRLRALEPHQRVPTFKQTSRPSPTKIDRIIEAMDGRGAWVTSVGLRYHPKTDSAESNRVIEMSVTARNLQQLAAYLKP